MRVALLGSPTKTNVELAFSWRRLGVDARVLWPREALGLLGDDDVAITRLDVSPTLDDVEPGLDCIRELEARGLRVLNQADALLACHDKLLTARRLEDAGIEHPWTVQLLPDAPLPVLPFPCVVKPRFGSWGQDVLLARTIEDLVAVVRLVADRPWWRRHGAIAQELVSDARCDLRIVVAGDRVVAGAERTAAPDEWRTNVTLGGRVVKAEVPPGTADIAIGAARAIGIDFAGVDLLPTLDGWVVLELNGAVDFDTRYGIPGVDPYKAILEALGIATPELAGAQYSGETTGRRVDMTKMLHGEPAKAGDEIVITGHTVGDSPRTAVILEVLGAPGTERFRVRWEDGHESIYFPGADAVIKRPKGGRRTKSRAV